MEPLSQLPIPLLSWYRDNARDLPWRQDPDPYRVWVSEIMLQQTRVAAVLGYYARFMDAYPTVDALARAPEEQLMKLWQGLGYYSRARNLQKAARQIMDRHGGIFPSDYREIRALAGVGDYTAAAIASIAFGQPLPAVDGNLLRVAARIMGDDMDITTARGKKHFTEALAAVMPLDAPGRFNQAMMDLGAMVCLPNGTPLCEKGPAAGFCAAHKAGRTGDLPVRPAKKPRRREDRVVFLLFRNGQVALRKRPDRGMLAGLWEYPNEAAPAEDFWEKYSIRTSGSTFGGAGDHVFSHVEWHMTARVADVSSKELPAGWVWAGKTDWAEDHAIPSAFSTFRDLVEGRLR